MAVDERTVNLEFPLGGIDVTAEFQEQKPGTTPEAVNVRGFDPVARRVRGGSRPGISHYPPDRVPANTALDMTIQHLNVIVDPHATALPQNFETPGDDWVEDPLNPGHWIPPGGWGVPPNPGVPDPPQPPTIVCDIIRRTFTYNPSFESYAIQLSNPPSVRFCECNGASLEIEWGSTGSNEVTINNILYTTLTAAQASDVAFMNTLFRLGDSPVGEGVDVLTGFSDVVVTANGCSGPG